MSVAVFLQRVETNALLLLVIVYRKLIELNILQSMQAYSDLCQTLSQTQCSVSFVRQSLSLWNELQCCRIDAVTLSGRRRPCDISDAVRSSEACSGNSCVLLQHLRPSLAATHHHQTRAPGVRHCARTTPPLEASWEWIDP